MKRLLITACAVAAVVAVPAQAKPGGGGKPDRVAKHQSKGKRCASKTVGYNARGRLVAANLTQTAGADTPTEAGDDRYGGTVEVDVTKANHRMPKGVQTFTLAGARVKFADADGDGIADQPSAGHPVKVHGKVTRLNRRCDAAGFTPTVTVKQVQLKAPPAPAPAG